MDASLRLRIDLGLLLLAVIAGSTVVAAYGLTDAGAVLATVGGLVVLTAALLFVGTTPAWARGDTTETETTGNTD